MQRKRTMVWTVVAAVLLAGGGGGGYWAFVSNKPASAAEEAAASTAVAKKGEIRQSVSGTSQFQAQSVQNITTPSSGTIKTMNLARSLPVKQGDVLFEIANPTLETDLKDAQSALSKLNRDLADLVDQQNHLKVAAPITGKLTLANNVDVGSSVNVNGKIGTISDNTSLTVKLAFPLAEVVQLKPGDPVDLSVSGYALTRTGTVASLGTQPKVDASGNKLVDVQINFENDGSLDAGLQVSGTVQLNGISVKSSGTAALEYTRIVNVVAKASGTITELKGKTGDIVNEGTQLVAIENKTLADSIADKQVDVEKQTAAVETAQSKLTELTVVAPFDGVFSSDFADQKKNVLTSYPIGAKVEAGVTFGAVANMSAMTLPIQVDELDLPSIKPGMKAEVRVDSLGVRAFEAEVASVSTVGVTTNGVTYYDVILTVKNPQDVLKYGMTATSEILIQDKKDAILVPIQALTTTRGASSVTVVTADGKEEKRDVKVGIRSKTQVEIAEGLKEGETVKIPVVQKTTNGTQQQIDQLRQQFQNGNFGGGQFPGGPGGVPAGAGGGAGGAGGAAGGAAGGGAGGGGAGTGGTRGTTGRGG